jgi:hypothetical protein
MTPKLIQTVEGQGAGSTEPNPDPFDLSKPEIASDLAASTAPIPDPLRLDNLKLPQDYAEATPVKKLLRTVPVRKPNNQTFFRVHPAPEFRCNFPMLALKEDGEFYVVIAALVPELATELVHVTLYTAIDRAGTLFLLPARLPGPDGKDMDWWRSLREACEIATESWVRIKSNRSMGAYDIFQAVEKLSEPEWPEIDYQGAIKLAFKNNLIDSLDHDVVKRLRGRL